MPAADWCVQFSRCLERKVFSLSPSADFVDAPGRLIFPTLTFHRLMEMARTKSNRLALDFQESLWKMYFEQGVSLTDAVLAEKATEHGIFGDKDVALAFILSGQLTLETQRKEAKLKMEYECHGVPFTVAKVNGKVVASISGAQPVENFVKLLQRMQKIYDAEKDAPTAGTASASCVVCGKPAPKRCSRCKNRSYCGDIACQKEDWQSHKAHCKPPSDAACGPDGCSL